MPPVAPTQSTCPGDLCHSACMGRCLSRLLRGHSTTGPGSKYVLEGRGWLPVPESSTPLALLLVSAYGLSPARYTGTSPCFAVATEAVSTQRQPPKGSNRQDLWTVDVRGFRPVAANSGRRFAMGRGTGRDAGPTLRRWR